MMRALILLHRWLGVAFCLLFAMWFASGIVMHFVPFPKLTEAEHFAGLAPLDLAQVKFSPEKVVSTSGIGNATRVRLLQRSDGPVYLVPGPSATKALRAADLSDAAVRSAELALAIARDYASRRHFRGANAVGVGKITRDQWTVAEHFDRYRPLYRIALKDGRGTELYVASTTGQIVLETTRRERAWNYLGSIAHWIYPTVLRSHASIWSAALWGLSLAALIGASAGALVGLLRIGAEDSRLLSPYRGWQAWHHWLGLICMAFVLTWMFSGWLSMDDGLLFSTGEPSSRDAAIVTGAPDWNALSSNELAHVDAQSREVEWFAFGGQIYRRERIGPTDQRLARVLPEEDSVSSEQRYLTIAELDALAPHLAPACKPTARVDRDDDYAVAPRMPDAPEFRLRCGDIWFDIDGANGVLLQKLDHSRRVYRWVYRALHTLDFPVLTMHPKLRTALIVVLCGMGFAFSITGMVIAMRRLRLSFQSPERP
jgi:PepSY-associated TM region